MLLGLRLSDHWLLLRTICRDYGNEKAKALLTTSVILGLKYGMKNNKQTISRIVGATKFEDKK